VHVFGQRANCGAKQRVTKIDNELSGDLRFKTVGYQDRHSQKIGVHEGIGCYRADRLKTGRSVSIDNPFTVTGNGNTVGIQAFQNQPFTVLKKCEPLVIACSTSLSFHGTEAPIRDHIRQEPRRQSAQPRAAGRPLFR
jgi:hypothetical protein